MANKPISFAGAAFEEVFGGGGSFFNSGLYRVLRSGFGFYDFGKKGNEALCLIQDIQPVNEKHKDEGEQITRYFAVGGKDREGNIYVEPCNPVKGEKGLYHNIRFTEKDTHGKLNKTSEFAVLMEYGHKNGIDMDAIDNDGAAFTGNVYEYGTVEIKKTERQKTAVEEAEGGEDGPKKPARDTKTYVIIVSQPKASKKAVAKDEDEDEAPKPKSKSKPAADDDDDDTPAPPKKKGKLSGPEAMVSEYLDTVIKKEIKKNKSADRNSHKLQFAKWLTNDKEVDADEKKAVMKVYNDDDQLKAVLAQAGLDLNDDDEFVTADED